MSTVALIVALILTLIWIVLPKNSARPEKPSQANLSERIPVHPMHWPPLGDYEFEIVGESNYQQAIAKIAGYHGTHSANKHCIASLIPEDDNPHDKSAVAVEIDGSTVGYLSREDARSFRRRLGRKGLSGQVTTCDALIVGGGTRKNGQRLHYGVRLDIKPFDR
jgi:hypothetical protein